MAMNIERSKLPLPLNLLRERRSNSISRADLLCCSGAYAAQQQSKQACSTSKAE
jgi:hypothetical protein